MERSIIYEKDQTVIKRQIENGVEKGTEHEGYCSPSKSFPSSKKKSYILLIKLRMSARRAEEGTEADLFLAKKAKRMPWGKFFEAPATVL